MENKKFDWKLLAQIILSVITLGYGWLSENQVVLVAFAAMLIVWLFDLLTKQGILVGKIWKTVAVLFSAFVIQVVVTHPATPGFPPYGGELGPYIILLLDYAGAWLMIAKDAAFGAMVIYNLLMEKVLEQLPDFFRSALRLK